MPLTKEQQTVIDAKIDNKLLLAGPGTGKSYTILGFITYLIQSLKIEPTSIFVITFTRSTTKELKEKIRKELGDGISSPNISTLHSFALRQLMKNSKRTINLPINFKIANDFEERYIIMEDLKRFLKIDIKEIKRLFRLLSANWETLNADTKDWQVTFENPEFLGIWQEHRNVYGYLLRSELVYQLKKILEEKEKINLDAPIEYLVVDEYQDLNRCDLAVIHFINKNGTKLFCAGDDDQSIYGFRFAYPEGIRSFTKEVIPSEEYKITECHRCDAEILSLATNVIRQDVKRIPKILVSKTEKKGEYHLLRFSNQYDEAKKIAELILQLVKEKGIPENEIIVLLRSDFKANFSKIIVQELIGKGITINQEIKFDLFDSTSGRYFLALIKYLMDSSHDLAIRTIFELTDGLGSVTFESIYDIAVSKKIRFHAVVDLILKGEITEVKNLTRIKDTVSKISSLKEEVEKLKEDANAVLAKIKFFIPGISEDFITTFKKITTEQEIKTLDDLVNFIDDLLGPVESPDATANGVRVMTMHKAKGLSSQAVFIVAAEDEYIPGKADVDESRRLFYVSLTRAKHFLFISYCNDRLYNQRYTGNNPRNTTQRNLTRYLTDLPIIKPEDGKTFVLK